jgi:type IV secretory pathway protease TraF
MSPFLTCILSAFGVVRVIAPSLTASRPILVWNDTASAPRGLYRTAAPPAVRGGDLVLLRPDPASAVVYAERGYLPLGVPLLNELPRSAYMSAGMPVT